VIIVGVTVRFGKLCVWGSQFKKKHKWDTL